MDIFPESFTALDFETANRSPDSACSVGFVTVVGGRLVDEARFLIRPHPLIFEPFNIRVHGITPAQVREAPTWDDLWSVFLPYLETGVWAAHNAGFDMRVLAASLLSRGIKLPEARYFCTVRTTKKIFPGLGSYNLGALAAHFDFELNHHDALSDARVCARLAVRALTEAQIWNENSFRGAGLTLAKFVDLDKNSPAPSAAEASIGVDPRRPEDTFWDKVVVFTGNLLHHTRDEAKDLVESAGGSVASVVSEDVDYLVWGRWHEGAHLLTTKLQRTQELRARGHRIRVLDEDTFRTLVLSTDPNVGTGRIFSDFHGKSP